MARGGRSGDAAALARTITGPGDQAAALTAIAQTLAQAGQPDRAAALARTMIAPQDQAAALTAIAQTLAQAGQPDRERSWPSRRERCLGWRTILRSVRPH